MGERIAERMKRLAAESSRSAAAPAAVMPPKQNDEARIATSENDAERRARTHRLVQIGAICDRYLGTKGLPPGEVLELLAEISRLDEVQRVISSNLHSSQKI